MSELQDVVRTALTAFEALQTGSVGVNGRTGALLHRSLTELATILARAAPALSQDGSETL